MRMNKIYLFLSFLFLLHAGNVSFAQGEQLFQDDFVHEIRISFSNPNFWSVLISNYDNNYPNVPYIMADVVIDGEAIDSIGVRLKGFTSYGVETDKKPIKLDFNEYVSGKKYDGLKKVNLNNGEGDPAMQRDRLAYDIFRDIGIPAPRTAYTRVYLNEEYWGLYILIEQVDKTFVKDNFANSEGNLFKNMGNSELDWQGADTTHYQQTFELKTAPKAGAWTRFVELMNVINNSSNADFKAEIEKVFDVDSYLKVLAVDVATNNWDSYIEHGRNFYMYEDPVSQKFYWIPWDYNLSMGGQFSSDFGGPGGGSGSAPNPDSCNTILNGSSPYPATDSVFIQVITIDPFCCDSTWDGACQGLYDNIAGGGNGSFPGGGFGSINFPIDMSNSQKSLISRLLAVPEYRDRYYQHWCGLVDNQLTTANIFPRVTADGNMIRSHITEDSNFVWSLAEFEEDLDQGNEKIPGLKKFWQERIDTLNIQMNALFDCNSISSNLAFQDIVINEFMASNDSLSVIKDEAGDTDDWIELYNNTNQEIDLSNAYLTDTISRPKKWAFPLGTKIAANGYLIIWADEDDGQPGLHANFKLRKAGEFIMLTDKDMTLDSLSFGAQTTNQSFSRIPNGTGNFVIKGATIGKDNSSSTTPIDRLRPGAHSISVFPNPARDYVTVKFEKAPKPGTVIRLFNSVGQNLYQATAKDSETILPLANLSHGIYFLRVENRTEQLSFHKKISVN